MKKCCACNELKEVKFFYVDKSRPDGRFAKCKKCFQTGKKCKAGRPPIDGIEAKVPVYKEKTGRQDSWLEIRLVNTSKQDYVETYKFLKRIGYKLSESIHEQFCEKHGLTPTELQNHKNHFSPKDLGLT